MLNEHIFSFLMQTKDFFGSFFYNFEEVAWIDTA